MTDIALILRNWASLVSAGYEVPAAGTAMTWAADEIERLMAEAERLQAENKRLREALRPFSELLEHAPTPDADDDEPFVERCVTYGPLWRARAALGGDDARA